MRCMSKVGAERGKCGACKKPERRAVRNRFDLSLTLGTYKCTAERAALDSAHACSWSGTSGTPHHCLRKQVPPRVHQSGTDIRAGVTVFSQKPGSRRCMSASLSSAQSMGIRTQSGVTVFSPKHGGVERDVRTKRNVCRSSQGKWMAGEDGGVVEIESGR